MSPRLSNQLRPLTGDDPQIVEEFRIYVGQYARQVGLDHFGQSPADRSHGLVSPHVAVQPDSSRTRCGSRPLRVNSLTVGIRAGISAGIVTSRQAGDGARRQI